MLMIVLLNNNIILYLWVILITLKTRIHQHACLVQKLVEMNCKTSPVNSAEAVESVRIACRNRMVTANRPNCFSITVDSYSRLALV